MSDIGRFSGNGGHWSGGLDMQRRDFAKRQEKPGDLADATMRHADDGDARIGAETLSLFQRSIRAAARNLGGGGPDDDQSDPFADARVLAEAQTVASTTGLPSLADLTIQPAPVPAAGTDMVRLVTSHVEEAIRADMRPSKAEPLTLQLKFAESTGGLTGLTLAVTPTTLDVVLDRLTADVTPELLAATAALADRLRIRFGKRVVRILDRVATPAEGATVRLSSLFAAKEG